MPAGAPMGLSPLLVGIELVSYSARAISLGLRLCANITAGHLLISIISSFVIMMSQIGGILSFSSIIPLSLILILMFLEVAVALIQAYVFTLLTAIYLHDALYLH
jgi:F-type H+-transporting ATPase subunit a